MSNPYDLWDRGAQKPRMCREMCDTCILRPGSVVARGLGPERLKQLIADARNNESYVVCHSTFDAEPAVCRGFADRYPTRGLAILTELIGFHEIDPPAKAATR